MVAQSCSRTSLERSLVKVLAVEMPLLLSWCNATDVMTVLHLLLPKWPMLEAASKGSRLMKLKLRQSDRGDADLLKRKG